MSITCSFTCVLLSAISHGKRSQCIICTEDTWGAKQTAAWRPHAIQFSLVSLLRLSGLIHTDLFQNISLGMYSRKRIQFCIQLYIFSSSLSDRRSVLRWCLALVSWPTDGTPLSSPFSLLHCHMTHTHTPNCWLQQMLLFGFLRFSVLSLVLV